MFRKCRGTATKCSYGRFVGMARRSFRTATNSAEILSPPSKPRARMFQPGRAWVATDPSKPRGNEMTYRVSYDDGVVRKAVRRTEYYRTEFEALQRARQLLEDGDHHGIALHDGGGSVLTGIRLELKLGLAVTD